MTPFILAIDPGPIESAFVVVNTETKGIINHGKYDNNDVLEIVKLHKDFNIAVEMIASYGMAVGREVFETCVWIGRFIEAHSGDVMLTYRKDIKLFLCGSVRATDSNVREALIDKLGQPGTSKNRGPTYGLRGDEWSALAVALTVIDSCDNTNTITIRDVIEGRA